MYLEPEIKKEDTDVPNIIVSAEASPISVPKVTTARKLVLPFSIDVTLKQKFSNITQPTPSKKTKIPVVWDTSTFNPHKLNKPQVIHGDLNITLGKSIKNNVTNTKVNIENPQNIKAKIKVTIRTVQRELYVSPMAQGGGNGSQATPFNSIQAAKEAIKKNRWNKNMTGDLLVWLAGGKYSVTEPITFDAGDSGSNGYSIIYQAVPGEVPNLNGGIEVTGWRKWNTNPKVYVAALDRNTKLRNLFVNGRQARMTSTVAKTCGPYGSVTITGDEAWAVDGGTETAGVLLKWDELGFSVAHAEELTNPEDIEISQKKTWNVVTVGLKEIKSVLPGSNGGAPLAKAVNISTDPQNAERNRQQRDFFAEKNSGRQKEGDTAFILQQPYGAIAACLAWQCNFEPYFAYVDLPGNVVENNKFSAFVIRNSLELLNKPGEFYFDKKEKKLYYYPENDVDIFKSEIVVPISDGLIRIKGNSTSDRVQNLQFSGIKFTCDDKGLETVENSEGFASVQNLAAYTKYVNNGDWHYWMYKNTDIPKGTVNVENARNIIFTGNLFTALSGSTCIGFINDVVDSQISGNVFMDTAGNASIIGHPQHVHVNDPDPLPELNKYPRNIEGVCRNIIVKNNYIENTCTMFTQADALTAFFVENVEFSHNTIKKVPYSGISFGWGWGNQDNRTNHPGTYWPDYPSKTARKNVIVSNHITHANQVLTNDGGALYVVGHQEDSIIAYNNVHGARSLYTDEGTAYFEIFYNDIDGYYPNKPYRVLWYGNRSNDDSHHEKDSFISSRSADNVFTTTLVPAFDCEADVPNDIAANAGIEPEWRKHIEELKSNF